MGGFFGSGRHKDVRLDGFSTRQEVRQRGPMTSLGRLVRAMERKDRRDLGRMIQTAQGRDWAYGSGLAGAGDGRLG